MSEQEQGTTEEWIYAGVRVLAGKRTHGWIEPSGRMRYYVDKGNLVIGGLYTVSVTRTDKNVMRGQPVYTGRMIDDDALRRQYFVEEHAAKTKLSAITNERNDAKVTASEIDKMLAPLIEVAASLTSQYDRDAFSMLVLRRIQSAWAPPRKI